MKPLPVEESQCRCKHSDVIALIKKRLSLKEISRDEKIVDKTCYKMIRYIQNGKNFSLDEIKDLLNGLELSSIAIQKRKKNIVERASRKVARKKR